MTAGREPRDPDGRRWMWAGIVVSILLGAWITAGVWGPRPQAGDDIQGQLAWNEFAIAKLFAHGRLDGWFPGFMVGYQKFLQYGPGYSWLVALVRVATLGILSTTGAVKVVSVLSVIAIGPAAAFLARSLGLRPLAAGIAAVLAMAVDTIYGLGPSAVFDVALLPSQMGAVWLFLALGAAIRVWYRPQPRWMLLLAGAGAMLVLTHPITLMVLAVVGTVAALALLAERRPPSQGWIAAVLGATSAALLAAFWLVPYAAHRDLAGPITAWRTPPIGERVRDILAGRFLVHRPLGWLLAGAAAGCTAWIATAVARRRAVPRGLAAAVVVAPAYFLIAHTAAEVAPHSAAGLELANRGAGISAVVAVLPLAALIAAAARRLPRAGSTVALAAAVLLVVVPGTGRGAARQEPAPSAGLVEAAAVLRREVPPTARFATERDYPDEIDRIGLAHPDFWLARHAGRNTLNVFAMELSQATGAAEAVAQIGHDSPGSMADDLARYGVTHVVTVRPDTADALAAAPDRFREIWRSGPLAVLAVVPRPGAPGPGGLLTADGPGDALVDGCVVSTAADPDHVRISLRADAPTPVTVAVAYSPKWRARLDGRAVPTASSRGGLLEVSVPAGTATLALDYGPDGWDRAGLAVTVVTLVALAAWAASRRARREARPQRTRRSSSSSRMSSSLSRTA